jgi:pyruvate ferredoxin oxidoreductase alpha subunit
MAVEMRERTLLTGAEVVAHAMRQIDPDVVPVYPITPQTPIVETFARLVADGLASSEIVTVESEHSALSAAVGAARAGARTMTATSSQGLALMTEIVYIAAAMRAPIVMALANRALSGPINIHGDHSDSMLIRDSGVVQLFAESAQEAYDLTVMAPRVAEHPDVLLPVLVCQDGFTVTHTAEPVELLADVAVAGFVGPYEIPHALLDSGGPTTQGPFAMPDAYFELRRDQERAIDAARAAFESVSEEFSELAGRRYRAVERYAADDADTVVVLLGSSAGTVREVVDELRAEGRSVGLVSIRSFRPFPHGELRAALSAARRVVVLDRSLAPGARPPLFADVAATLLGRAVLCGYVYGLGGRELLPRHVRRALDEAPDGHIGYLGLED